MRSVARQTTALAGDPLARVWDALEREGFTPRGQTYDFRARCPAHDGDNDQALHVSIGADGRALLWCFRGCGTDDVTRALGLTFADLFPDGHRHAHRPRQLAKPRDPVDVILDAVREHGLDYRCTNGGELWVVESCPACNRDELWIHEEHSIEHPDRPGRVRLCCMNGCPQHEVFAALAGVTP